MIENKNSSVQSKEEICERLCKKNIEEKAAKYCYKHCLNSLRPGNEVQKHEIKPTNVNQKESLEQTVTGKTFTGSKTAIIKKASEKSEPVSIRINSKSPGKNPNRPLETIFPSDKTENEYKCTLNCRDGKICPTISIIVDRKKLEQAAKLAIESALNHKLSEIMSAGISQKESYSGTKPENDGKEESCKNAEIRTTVTTPIHSNSEQWHSESKFSNNIDIKNLSNLRKGNQHEGKPRSTPNSIISQKGVKSELSIHKSVYVSHDVHTYGSINNGKIGTQINRDVKNPSIEIKSTDLTKKPSQHSVSLLSYDPEEENELDKWKKNCQEGVFALQSLVDKCEKDPNSVLSTFKVSLGTDRKLPNGSSETIDEPEPLYILEKTHGDHFGNPKYHLLMVDASTSIHTMDFRAPPKEQLEKIPQRSSVHYEGNEVAEETGKDKPYQTSYVPPRQQEKSEETIPEVLQLQQSMLSQQLQLSQKSPKQSPQQSPRQSPQQSPQQSPRQSLEQAPLSSVQKEQKPPPPKEKKTSIIFKEVTPAQIIDEEEKKRQNARRPSGVSWRAINTPSDSDSTASLDQVVKDATAKAETFRQNLDAKRQHSLLDIVKRKSTIDKKIEEVPKPPTPPSPKRKKFFNFKCREKKKQPEKEKGEAHTDSEEESVEELQEKKNVHSSSMYLDNYRRRNTSFIENPVFEKKKELNQFLNNI